MQDLFVNYRHGVGEPVCEILHKLRLNSISSEPAAAAIAYLLLFSSTVRLDAWIAVGFCVSTSFVACPSVKLELFAIPLLCLNLQGRSHGLL